MFKIDRPIQRTMAAPALSTVAGIISAVVAVSDFAVKFSDTTRQWAWDRGVAPVAPTPAHA